MAHRKVCNLNFNNEYLVITATFSTILPLIFWHKKHHSKGTLSVILSDPPGNNGTCPIHNRYNFYLIDNVENMVVFVSLKPVSFW